MLVLVLALLLCNLLFAGQQPRTENRLLVKEIRIEGNKKTKASVIRNYLSFQEGDSISRSQLEASRLRLKNTGFFKVVDVLLEPADAPASAVVTIRVRERRGLFLQIRGGFNELDGWYFSPLSVRFDNLFGHGLIMGFELLIGDRIDGNHLEIKRPFLWGSEYDLGLDLFNYTQDFVHFLGGESFNQEVRRSGILVKLQGNSGLARFFSLAYQAQTVEVDSFLRRDDQKLEGPLLPQLTVPGHSVEVRRFILSATVDTRDVPIQPGRGWWGGLVYDQSARSINSFRNYFRLVLDVRRYQPLWRRLVLAVRLKLGRVSNSAPFFDKFYFGGPNSLRGYQDRSLTPPGYASRLTLLQTELRFPLSRRLKDPTRLSGVLFFDTGMVWNPPDRWSVHRLVSGLGYGLRARLPIVGLIRMDLAYSLPDLIFQFHFSLGHTF